VGELKEAIAEIFKKLTESFSKNLQNQYLLQKGGLRSS